MKISEEQIEKYIDDNWNQYFYKAFVQCVSESLFDKNDIEAKKEYRNELKQSIWEAVAQGVRDYLEGYDGEAVKIISKEFLKEFSNKEISININ
jgi:hypothetical protein